MRRLLPIASRERVITLVEERQSHCEDARHFRPSTRFVNNLAALKRETDLLHCALRGTLGMARLQRIRSGLANQLAQHSDLMPDELYIERGIIVHRSSAVRLPTGSVRAIKKPYDERASANGDSASA